MSNATDGGNWLGARSWAIPLTTTSAPAGGGAIVPGAYKLSTDAETYVALGVGTVTAPDLSSVTSQPSTPNSAFHMPAGSMEIVEIADDNIEIAARTKSGTGTLHISGPIRKAAIA